MQRRVLAIGGATMVLAAGIGGGVAYAANDSTPGTGTAAHTTAAITGKATANTTATAKRKTRPLLRRALHGQFTVKTKDGFRTVQVQRGTISAVSSSRITIVSADHYSHTYVLDAKTRVRVDKQHSTASKLTKGAHASIATGPRLGTNTAARVLEHTK
jgi:hypothetical protein